MAFNARPGETYTIRRKVFRLFGAGFHVYGPDGTIIGYCNQKAFKLKEDIRLYADEERKREILSMKARSIIDFGATYDVAMPGGEVLGSFRRKGLKSTFLADEWTIHDPSGMEIATLKEQGSIMPFLRRYVDWVAFFSPQKFDLERDDGEVIATFRTHFNPIVHRMSIAILADDDDLDDLMILAGGCLLAAIEGRQN